jgi:putative ABC transport system substrate-binding protein
MRRREFLTLLSGAAVAYPLAARAQQAGKLPTIGFLVDSASANVPRTTAFVERLRELGWIEGRTVAIEYRWSEGRPERVAEIAAAYVQQKVDVIVTYGSAAVQLKRATASIPIVFAVGVDPIGSGLVASLSRPGGNVTGLSLQQSEIGGKRLELLRQLVPGLRRLAMIFDPGYPVTAREVSDVQVAARNLGLEVAPHGIQRAEDIAPVFDALKGQADALYVVENALIWVNGTRIAALALNTQLPTTFNSSDLVKAGGLMSYGADFPALFVRAADYVDKILRGTKPGDIPVEQPTKFDLVLNLKTAKALGLTVPDKLLALANEVIE